MHVKKYNRHAHVLHIGMNLWPEMTVKYPCSDVHTKSIVYEIRVNR